MSRAAKYAAREKAVKKRATFAGLRVTVDRPRGHVVRGVDSLTGEPYEVTYSLDYGYLPRTRGGDGEGLDVFLGPDEQSARAFWATHLRDDGSFDEYKLFLGFNTARAARDAYEAHYPARWFGGMREGTVDQVRALVGVDPGGDVVAPERAIDVVERSTERRLSLLAECVRLVEGHPVYAAARVGPSGWSGGLVACDLSVNDVNSASTDVRMVPARTPTIDEMLADYVAKVTGAARKKTAAPAAEGATKMALDADERGALPADEFALPAQRKYPLNDAAHVRNATARLEQMKGRLTPSEYAAARARVARAAKRFGVESEYNAKAASKAKRRVAVRAHLGEGGELHVRHLSLYDPGAEVEFRLGRVALDDDVVACASKDDDAPVWVQIAKTGTFHGHRSGSFRLDGEVFAHICRNFREVSAGQVPFDFEHASEQPPAEGDIATEGAPAQGWIKDLKHDGQALFALVEWLEPARTYIKQKKYRFVSPAIRFGVKHPESGQNVGAVLTSAALTNVPFLTGMQPIAASLTGGRSIDLEEVSVSDSIEGASHAVMKLAHSPDEYMGARQDLPRSARSLHCLRLSREADGSPRPLRGRS
jgi:hypothetical protein